MRDRPSALQVAVASDANWCKVPSRPTVVRVAEGGRVQGDVDAGDLVLFYPEHNDSLEACLARKNDKQPENLVITAGNKHIQLHGCRSYSRYAYATSS